MEYNMQVSAYKTWNDIRNCIKKQILNVKTEQLPESRTHCLM